MNVPMVRHLIRKDWYFNRWLITTALILGLASLILCVSGTPTGFYMGATLLITVLIGAGTYLITETVLRERTDQTLPFVMSLPVSYLEYSTVKILGNIVIFLVPFGILTIGTWIAITGSSGIADGLLPMAVLLLFEILSAYTLILAVAVITESMGWTIGTMVVLNLVFQLFLFTVARIPDIAQYREGPIAVWNAPVFLILAGEISVITLAIVVTFYFQSRKTDFL